VLVSFSRFSAGLFPTPWRSGARVHPYEDKLVIDGPSERGIIQASPRELKLKRRTYVNVLTPFKVSKPLGFSDCFVPVFTHMKLVYTKDYQQLAEALSSLEGEWDVTQADKKVFRLKAGILNWFESTGTLQFQGKEPDKSILEARVKSLLFPGQYPQQQSEQDSHNPQNEEPVLPALNVASQTPAERYLNKNLVQRHVLILG
jgi:hypothetical protein